MKKYWVFLWPFLTSFLVFFGGLKGVFASIPLPESLFRNGNNKEITSNFVSYKFSLAKLNAENDYERGEKKYIHLIYFIEGPYLKQVKMVFANSQMRRGSELAIEHRRFLLAFDALKGKNYEGHFEREGFFGLMTYLLLNRSDFMVTFLKKADEEFLLNKDLIKKEKVELLGRYKRYLKKISLNPLLKEAIESPLKPADEEKRQEVEAILKGPTLSNPQQVSLKRIKGAFYWELKRPHILAQFTNSEHRLKRLWVRQGEKGLEIRCEHFLSFNGIHELPKYISLKDSFGDEYLMQTLELKHRDLRPRRLEKMKESYLKLQKQFSARKRQTGFEQLRKDYPFL